MPETDAAKVLLLVLELKSVDRLPTGGARATFVLDHYDPVMLPADYVSKYSPQPGGYFVRYFDNPLALQPATYDYLPNSDLAQQAFPGGPFFYVPIKGEDCEDD